MKSSKNPFALQDVQVDVDAKKWDFHEDLHVDGKDNKDVAIQKDADAHKEIHIQKQEEQEKDISIQKSGDDHKDKDIGIEVQKVMPAEKNVTVQKDWPKEEAVHMRKEMPKKLQIEGEASFQKDDYFTEVSFHKGAVPSPAPLDEMKTLSMDVAGRKLLDTNVDYPGGNVQVCTS